MDSSNGVIEPFENQLSRHAMCNTANCCRCRLSPRMSGENELLFLFVDITYLYKENNVKCKTKNNKSKNRVLCDKRKCEQVI